METLPPRAVALVRWVESSRPTLLLLPLFLSLAGCATTESALHWGAEKPSGNPCQVVATWNPQVVFTPDPVHAGTPTPGLVGRVYLFGEEIDYPEVGDGSLVVDLYDETSATAAKASVPLEEWRIDKATLKRLKRRDPIGWGYTLFLPWATYKPEITTVRLRLRYVPAKGTPLYAESIPLVFNKGGIPIAVSADTKIIRPNS